MSNEPSNSLGTTPARCSTLRKGGYVMIKGHPCKIMDLATSAPGKHGHAKIHIVGLDLFSKKRFEDIQPSSHNVDVPQVLKVDMQLVSIGHEGYLSLLDDAGYIQHHLALPDDPLGESIRQKYDNGECVMVVILKALDLEAVYGYKIVKD